MTNTESLPLIDTNDSTDSSTSGACGCGCGCGTSTTTTDTTSNPTQEDTMSEQTTQSFQVTGMTCGHCASAVTDELKQLPGVTDVTVDLVAGGTSTVDVTGTEPLDDSLVSTALEEAGDYQLA